MPLNSRNQIKTSGADRPVTVTSDLPGLGASDAERARRNETHSVQCAHAAFNAASGLTTARSVRSLDVRYFFLSLPNVRSTTFPVNFNVSPMMLHTHGPAF